MIREVGREVGRLGFGFCGHPRAAMEILCGLLKALFSGFLTGLFFDRFVDVCLDLLDFLQISDDFPLHDCSLDPMRQWSLDDTALD